MRLCEYYFDPPIALGLVSNPGHSARHDIVLQKPIKYDGYKCEICYAFAKLKQEFEKERGPQIELSPGSMSYYAHVDLFRNRKGKMYVMPPDFFKELIRAEINSDISNMFPKDWSAWVSLPAGALMHQNSKMPLPMHFRGFYLSTVQNPFLGSQLVSDVNQSLFFTGISDLKENSWGVVNGMLRLVPGLHSLKDLIALNISDAVVTNPEYQDIMLKAMVLMTIYINSANPDLRHLKPQKELSKSRMLGMANRGINFEETHSPDIGMPVELVSWGWKKPNIYSKDEWLVPAHFNTYWTGKGRVNREIRYIAPVIAKRNPDLIQS